MFVACDRLMEFYCCRKNDNQQIVNVIILKEGVKPLFAE